MVNRADSTHFALERLIKLYMWVSFLSIGLILFSHFIVNDVTHYGSFFFSATLLVGTFAFINTGWPLLGAPYLFLFQALFFMGMSYELSSWSLVFMSFLPCALGVYYFLFKSGEVDLKQLSRSTALLGVVLCSGLALWLANRPDPFAGPVDFLVFLLFGGVAFLVFSSGVDFHFDSGQNRVFQQHNSNKYDRNQVYTDSERLFVHDLINHTHGINLFLSGRVNNEKGLTHGEVCSLVAEIKSLQSLIKDYYRPGHKNLVNTYEWVDLDMVKRSAFQLCESFLSTPAKDVNITIINREEFEKMAGDWQLHFPTFFRVLSNLVKNIAEQEAPEVEISLEVKNSFLQIYTRNSISGLDIKSQTLHQQLADAILQADIGGGEKTREREKLGLVSAQVSAEKAGGEYHFWIEQDCWINLVRLPLTLSDSGTADDGQNDPIAA